MKSIFIDDIRNPKIEDFDAVLRTSSEAILWMEENKCPNYISFDHDLGEDDHSMKIVRWMIDRDLDDDGDFIPKGFTFNVHSANPVGARNITESLHSYLNFRMNKSILEPMSM